MDDSALAEKLLSGSEVFHGAIINVEHWQALLPNGKTALREIVRHRGAAAIVPVDGAGRVTLVRQYRAAIGRFTWEIPAGKLDNAGEDPQAAAVRELEEETGLRAMHWKKLTVLDTTPGFCDEQLSLFLATGLSQHEAHTDDDEFLNVARVPLADAVQRVMNGEITDSKTIAGLLMACFALRGDSLTEPLNALPIQRAPGAFASRGE